jgi:hypothetical protein
METFPGELAGVEGAETGDDTAGFVGAAAGGLGADVTTLPEEDRYQFA